MFVFFSVFLIFSSVSKTLLKLTCTMFFLFHVITNFVNFEFSLVYMLKSSLGDQVFSETWADAEPFWVPSIHQENVKNMQIINNKIYIVHKFRKSFFRSNGLRYFKVSLIRQRRYFFLLNLDFI